MQEVVLNTVKKIRFTYLDPDVTDSSSDEEIGPNQRKPNREVREIVVYPSEKRFISNLKRKRKSSEYVGVRRRESGNYAAEIRNQITKKRDWLGTFPTPEEAAEAYLSRRREINEKLRALQGHEEITNQNDNVSAAENHTSNTSSENDNVSAENVEEDKIGYVNGVEVADNDGYLTGELSEVDDLSVCVGEDGKWC